MDFRFLVRKGKFNWSNPNEVGTSVHVRIDSTHINAEYPEDYYDELQYRFNAFDIETLVGTIIEACDRVISNCYNSQRDNAKKIKEITKTREFYIALDKYLAHRIENEISKLKKRIEALETIKDKNKDLVISMLQD